MRDAPNGAKVATNHPLGFQFFMFSLVILNGLPPLTCCPFSHNQCSIDALLDRTIKHMLFLQSVTKYAEKIKQADEPKVSSFRYMCVNHLQS
jgi:hypothetical protein